MAEHGPCIYTGAEAAALLDALCANRTPAPWSVGDRVLTNDSYDVRVIKSADRDSVGHVWASAFDGDHDDIALKAAATLAAAAPDIAASVVHHAARADKAEAEVERLRSQIRTECEGNGYPPPDPADLAGQLRHLTGYYDAEIVTLKADCRQHVSLLRSAREERDEAQALLSRIREYVYANDMGDGDYLRDVLRGVSHAG